MNILGPEEFLLGVEFQVTCSDGSVYENVVWKYCSDSVLRWFKTDGTQVTGIVSISEGVMVTHHYLLHQALADCQEER